MINPDKVQEKKIPTVGYDGYIRGYKSENMFGKSFRNTTSDSAYMFDNWSKYFRYIIKNIQYYTYSNILKLLTNTKLLKNQFSAIRGNVFIGFCIFYNWLK